jgi:hypothetical protein
MAFVLADYIALNKDLKFKSDGEYLNHYKTIGSKQMRLRNRRVLDITDEYACEVLLYIPYIYYLFTKGLLFDNKVTVCTGMRPYYYFLPDTQVIEVQRNRRWIPSHQNALPVNKTGHIKEFDRNYWVPPPYKMIFKNKVFHYSRSLLVIHNKYNKEWNVGPINFFDVSMVLSLISLLKNTYQIVYIRPSSKISNISLQGYSFDHTTNLELNDFEMIEKHHPDIIIFEKLMQLHQLDYNKCKLMLYANCDNFITTQGGNANFTAYFAKNLLIYHKRGRELEVGSYNTWHRTINPEGPCNVYVSTDFAKIVDTAKKVLM